MSDPLDGQILRKTLFEVIDEFSKIGPGYFQSRAVLEETKRRLKIHGQEKEQALLTFFHDLLRGGYLAWGFNITNPDPPFLHLTEQGKQVLRHISRDPANPVGYLDYILEGNDLNPVAISYLEEALNTYSSNCYKAAAVMIGASTESIVLNLRDILVEGLRKSNQTIPKKLQDWRIKRILDGIKQEFENQKSNMPYKLAESFEAYWPAFTQQIRTSRNDAGHPKSIEPVTHETVHASLLIFPELTKLSTELLEWIKHQYKV